MRQYTIQKEVEMSWQEIYEELKMRHLEEAGETYFEHMKTASCISYILLTSGAKCLIHSIVPPLFETAVSSKMGEIVSLVARNEAAD